MKNKGSLLMMGGLIGLLLFSGCALFLIGAGVAGGVAISDDEIEGVVDRSYDKVWKASHDVLTKEGFVKSEDRPHGSIEGEVGKSEVKISIAQLTERTVRIRVKARKDYKVVPDLQLANELYNKIFQKIK